MYYNKATKFFLVVILSFTLVSCASTGYLIENFQDYQSSHEKVAILPVDVKINIANQPKGTTQDDLDRQAKDDSIAYQKLLHSRLLDRFGKGSYTVSFQDADDTNTLLRRNNAFDNLGKINKTKIELNDILKVDAILSTSMRLSKPMTQGGAIVTGLLFGVGSANKADINVYIHDSKTGVLIWNFERSFEGTAFSNEDQLVRALVSAVSSTFPYKKKKQ